MTNASSGMPNSFATRLPFSTSRTAMTTKCRPVLARHAAVFKPSPDDAPVITVSFREPILTPPSTLAGSFASGGYIFSGSSTCVSISHRLVGELVLIGDVNDDDDTIWLLLFDDVVVVIRWERICDGEAGANASVDDAR